MPEIIPLNISDELSLPISIAGVGVDCRQNSEYFPSLDHSRIIFTKSGGGTAEVNGKKISISEKEAAFIARGVSCTLSPGTGGWTTDWFSFDISSDAMWYSMFTKNMLTLFEVDSTQTIENGIANIYDCIEPSQSYSGYLASAAAYKLLVEMNSEATTKKMYNKKTTGLVDNVVTFIEKNLTKEITLKELCDEAGGISEQYLCRLFKKQTGERPVEYILHKRINMARSYLENTDIPIPVVASSTGFNNTSYFYRNFKKFSGVSPLVYRKMSVAGREDDDAEI